jgi:hypothetical protein
MGRVAHAFLLAGDLDSPAGHDTIVLCVGRQVGSHRHVDAVACAYAERFFRWVHGQLMPSPSHVTKPSIGRR